MIYLQRIGINSIKYEYEDEFERETLDAALTLKIKGAHFSKKFQKGYWDGTVHFYNKMARTFPYGFLEVLLPKLERKKVEFHYSSDEIIQPFIKKLPYTAGMWQHQQEALDAWFVAQFGIIQIPTRGGKTKMYGEALRQLQYVENDMVALFIVDTQDLYLQARADLADHLSVKLNKIGGIKEDDFNIQPITVATIQTLMSIDSGIHKIKKEGKTIEEIRTKRTELRVRRMRLLQYMKQVNFLGVDECHEYSGSNRISFLEKFRKDIRRMMISATPFKSEDPVANYNLRKISGPVLYKVTEQTLKERGILSKDKIVLIYIDHTKDKNIAIASKDDYRAYQKKVIIENFNRNMILVNTVEICRKLLLKVLVLFSSKQHGYFIQTITGDDFISGDNNTTERTVVKNRFLKRKGGVCMASDIFKKGITLPEAEVMVNASGGLEKVNVIQKKGRVLGTTQVKTKSLIIDIIDDFTYFKDHSLNRISAYEKSVLDKRDIVVFDARDKEFYNDLRDYIESWFER